MYQTNPTSNENHDFIANELYNATPQYAGFWLRVGATFIDAIIIYVAMFILAMPLGISLTPSTDGEFHFTASYWLMNLAGFLYGPIMESSKYQATFGKKALGLTVTDMSGQRLSFLNALGRTLGKILSAIILYIGFIMCAFTDKKQCLHDKIAGTLVVKS